MSDPLSEDLRSLRIEREAPSTTGSGARKLLWVGLGVLVLGGAAYAAVSGMGAALFPTEVEVTEAALVSPSTGTTLLTASGYVQAKLRSMVGVKQRGRVAQVNISEGDEVQPGQVLLELEAGDQKSAVAAARARIAAARARAKAAEANAAEVDAQLRRARVLAEGGATAQATVEDLVTRLSSLNQSVEAANAEISAAQAEATALAVGLGSLTVTAPIRGTVVSRPPEVGELLSDAPAFELVDMSSLMVEVDVPEARLGMVRKGTPAEIVLDAYPGERRRGEVFETGSKVNRAKATVMVRVRFVDDLTRILPDMSARVTFLEKSADPETLKAPPKLVVPRSAVTERSGAPVVFAVDGGIARMTSVTLGPAFGDGFEVQGGLAPGTKLVRQPPSSLTDGQKIKERQRP